jgi:hypothetical protein
MLLNEFDMEVVSKEASRVHEMDDSHVFGSNHSLNPSGPV